MTANNNPPRVLGILGGLGPMATVYFYEMLTAHTSVTCDQDHIDVIINSRATTPDRTKYILGQSTENPFDIMAADAARLVTFGADILAIPCNTAHFFYAMLDDCVNIPILNMVRETVKTAVSSGAHKLGILATSGTIQSETYQKMCNDIGIDWAVPSENKQNDIMNIIYDNIKKGKRADINLFDGAVKMLVNEGCDKIVLGCTELSLVKKDEKLNEFYLDSMEVLAKSAILAFGKTPVGL